MLHLHLSNHMMTSSNRSIFRVTGPLCGEFTSHRWIPHTNPSDVELYDFFCICPWTNGWVKQWRCWRFEMPLRSLWQHCNVILLPTKVWFILEVCGTLSVASDTSISYAHDFGLHITWLRKWSFYAIRNDGWSVSLVWGRGICYWFLLHLYMFTYMNTHCKLFFWNSPDLYQVPYNAIFHMHHEICA